VCDVKKVTALAPYHEGIERFEVPAEYKGFFFSLVKQKDVSSAASTMSNNVSGNANKSRLLYSGKIYSVTLPQLGTIKVLGANEDEVWNVIRAQSVIEEFVAQ
jgi:ABC-type xylose transport system substrate-binding protein